MKIDMPKEWLKASQDDLKVVEKIIDMPDLTHISAFHCHQSIEKALKALLEAKGVKVPKKHDLLELTKRTQIVLETEEEDMMDSLNTLYIESRYPADMGLLPYGKPTLEDASAFYSFATAMFDRVCKMLSLDKEELK